MGQCTYALERSHVVSQHYYIFHMLLASFLIPDLIFEEFKEARRVDYSFLLVYFEFDRSTRFVSFID